jgi:uncharacterized protein (DUF427 family)
MTQTAEPTASEGIGRVRTEPNQRRVRVFFGGEAVADIENLLAFYNDKTDILVDGIPQERPVTKWS